MSDSENYFSDTDKSEGEEEPIDDFFEQQEQEYELDEETRRIIYDSSRTKDYSKKFFEELEVPKKKKREKKIKANNTISLAELEEQTEQNKSKKWSGKRFSDKKKEMGISNTKIKKRQFNPRLPIPSQETFRKVNIIDDIDIDINGEDFPELEV
jgi:hypothetical protein